MLVSLQYNVRKYSRQGVISIKYIKMIFSYYIGRILMGSNRIGEIGSEMGGLYSVLVKGGWLFAN